MSKKDVQLNIRITQELKDKIEESAKKNNRSINAEAITLMERSLKNKNMTKASVLGDNDDIVSAIKNSQPDLSEDAIEASLMGSFDMISSMVVFQNKEKIKELAVNSLLDALKKRDELGDGGNSLLENLYDIKISKEKK
ncbi:Arc family DNA-binding protein [Providencia rettgeri]|uniref:Arc family DNA-binding protein n=1 Tax=Providencia rettgeri TaxID=587 RepID=UPI001CA73D5A|nr:Arc family DNA-binding protein [Providencia rettgeri]MCL0010328.1 Arc family DNA-binding protein [Providencia rettgeri]QZY66102.1 Arc family DNA-binding protein [Providencia rettgeri]